MTSAAMELSVAAEGAGHRSSLPAAPFAGMRPFERDEHEVFKGRDRDANLLADKIFSSRVTVVYGPSGVGKSSILATLVVPRLEDEDARVLSYDRWRGDDPASDLAVFLSGQGGPNGAAAPAPDDLVAVVRTLQERLGCTVILVLDQLEEFFTTRHPIERLRRELGALARAPGIDLRLVLSLREEHLAALEPIRLEIPSLFQCTYRLEPLRLDKARLAIEEPARLFGAPFEDLLVAQLLEDVRLADDPAAADLPILQLLCAELWKESRLQEPPAGATLALYRSLGGRDGVLQRFLQRVMPHGPLGRLRVARLMEHLAPDDGHKLSYSVAHLARVTGIAPGAAEPLLERLATSQASVLRSRKYGGAVLYELQHDAFVRIIAPWRDRVLGRARVLRWAGRTAVALAAAGALLAAFGAWQDGRQLRRNTDEVLASETHSDAEKLDRVASYLLWTRPGPRSLDLLHQLLSSPDAPRPAGGYGIDSSGVEHIRLPSQDEPWPLTLEYSAFRDLDERYFELTWQNDAQFLIERWRVPVPLQLKLVRVETLPGPLVRLLTQGLEPLDLALERHEDLAFLTGEDLQPRGQEFLHRFARDWTVVAVGKNGPWFGVPRWSLPVWKAAGTKPTDGSGFTALLLALELQKRPAQFLSREAVELLLKDASASHPRTVSEARAARGDRLAADLVELVRRDRSLKQLDLVLDLLAAHPDDSPERAAELVAQEELTPRASLPAKLPGPWSPAPPTPAPAAEPSDAYRDVGRRLPRLDAQVRLHLGPDSMARWWVDGAWRPEFSRALARARDDALHRFGIDVGDIVEYEAGARGNFRLELLNQDQTNDEAKPIPVAEDSAAERLLRELRFRIQALRALLLRSEDVSAQLEEVGPGVRSWLERRYSLTGLKLIERAVLSPDEDELRQNSEYLASSLASLPQVDPGRTVRDPGWLLSSLVFWSLVEDPASPDAMGERLRETQEERARPARGMGSEAGGEAVRSGVSILAGDLEAAERTDRAGTSGDRRLESAGKAFAQALSRDRPGAVRAFLAAWAEVGRRRAAAAIDAGCADPVDPKLSRPARVDLEARLSSPELETWPAPRISRLRTCLLAADPESYEAERARLASELLDRQPDPDTWDPGQAAWLSRVLLARPLVGVRSIELAVKFMRSAVARLPGPRAAEAFAAFAASCLVDGPLRSCREQLAPIADASQAAEVWVEAAWRLRDSERQDELRSAQRFAERALDALARRGDKEGARLMEYARLSRERAAASDGLRLLVDSKEVGPVALSDLVDVLLRAGRAQEADALLPAQLDRYGEHWVHPSLLGAQLLAALRSGERERVAKVGDFALQRTKAADKPARGYQFIAAVGLMMAERGPWEEAARAFLRSRDPNAPYVAMMLTSRMGGPGQREARMVLERLWALARPGTWDERLEQGDVTAWREMLIGLSVGRISRDRVLGDLEDEARFARSPKRHLPLPRSGLLCEGYFYEALLAEAAHDTSRVRERLQRVLSTGEASYYEYGLAQYLLRKPADLGER